MMQGYLSLVLHAHLPFVRHPEHELFLEENWLFEAVTESYIPLLQMLRRWNRDGIPGRLTLTLTPTLCSMLLDPLLQERYERYLNRLAELAEKEVQRTHWDKALRDLALQYQRRFREIRETYFACGRNLVAAFRELQELGTIEIITCAATHALLPLLAAHPPSVRAQLLIARDHYRSCFARDPGGVWLPECAYAEGVEDVLKEAGIRWFITDTHGILHAQPRPRFGMFAPIFTPNGIAAFGRDMESARQVWSRDEGYPGDPRYRDFYRDIGFDLEFEYLRPYLPAPDQRGFTGIKYYRITGPSPEKQPYDRTAALRAAAAHAEDFLRSRASQVRELCAVLDRPPILVSPYDAELFGHWWYEGPEFLDHFVRKACSDPPVFGFITPGDYLQRHPTNQVARPSPSSWGEEGYWRVWLNEANEWILPHLHVAQGRMTEMARRLEAPDPLQERVMKQAGRELLLAQSSDWPFILRTGTSPDYARRRVKEHLLQFNALYEQLTGSAVSESSLAELERKDNLFPDLDWRYWG